MDSASLDRGCLSGHSHDLIPLRGYANSVDVVSSEVLHQAETGSFPFDNESTRWRHPTPAVIVLKYCPLQVWIFKARSDHIEDVNSLVTNQQHNARRVVSKLAAAEGGVPTDNDFVAWQRSRRLVVKLEPRPLDKIAASWNRRLLILRRELHCTHRCLQFIESTLGFPSRMRQTTHPTTTAAGRA